MKENINLLINYDNVTYEEYMKVYEKRIIPDSEKIFVRDFLFPILGNDKMKYVIPQYPFIDSEGHRRQIDFGIVTENNNKIAFEINGEVYHAEGIIPSAQFDDNLFRQNEILFHGWTLRRYSYNQLLNSEWRERLYAEINLTLKKYAPELLGNIKVEPNIIQKEVLPQIKKYRDLGWNKGLVIMPTGTGKTYLTAMDAYNYYIENPNSKFLFIAHRIDLLSQSRNAFENIWTDLNSGLLTGEVKENINNCTILFASKDSLYRDATLNQFNKTYFDYIIVDEVHHGEAETYKKILNYFEPKFLLGITATPERTDKKDILRLFDYQKICEYDINDAIDKGFLVGYEYHGLKDNVDYTNIRYNGNKYNEKDLEKHLIIEKRNQEIYNKYIELCNGDKAIGFCVSIKHAESTADFFNKRGISAVAITSASNKEQIKSDLIKAFKDNKYSIAFVVDIFNEGIDIPNVRALLFLRPTESKTIFLQQLGRGLRLSSNKDKLIVLDFISNYKRANFVRKYMATNCYEKTKENSNAYEKMVYEYNPKCKVIFDDEVQQILDIQDSFDHNVNKDDLIEAYYDLMTEIKRKPNQNDINQYGKYKVIKYINTFGGWINFLREIGEITENGYHYPQGLHFGHILYILNILANNKKQGSYLDDMFIKMRGNLSKDDEELSRFQRQTKYKIQGMMGMGLIVDDRKIGTANSNISLTDNGNKLYNLLKPLIDKIDLSFKNKDKTYTWEMQNTNYINDIKNYLDKDENVRNEFIAIMLNMDAVRQALKFLYFENRKKNINKSLFYKLFFQSKEVIDYCELNGIEIPSEEAAKHRLPFILSILEIIGVITIQKSDFTVNKIILFNRLFDDCDSNVSVDNIINSLSTNNYTKLSENDIEYLKEKFGSEILKSNFYIKSFIKIKEEI